MIRHYLKIGRSVPPVFHLRVESELSEDGFRRAGGLPDSPVEDDGWSHVAWLGKGTPRDGPEAFPHHLGTFSTLAEALAAAKDDLGMNVDEPTPLVAAEAAGEVD